MGEVVNLRRARKAKLRAAEDTQAADNRRRFGRPKAEREALEHASTIASRRLDGHRLDEPEGS